MTTNTTSPARRRLDAHLAKLHGFAIAYMANDAFRAAAPAAKLLLVADVLRVASVNSWNRGIVFAASDLRETVPAGGFLTHVQHLAFNALDALAL